MKKGTGVLLITSALVLILIIIIVKSYSSLSSLKEDSINKEADINVQLNRNVEQVNGIINKVNELVTDDSFISEKTLTVLEKIKDSDSIKDKSKKYNELSNELNTLFEKIKDNEILFNNDEIKEMMNELLSTEKRIENAVNNYNNIVEDYNNTVNNFPTNIIAKIFGYKERDIFNKSVKIVNIFE